jgi:hypothetical protein
VEGVRWTMTKEEKAATTKRKKATVSIQRGCFDFGAFPLFEVGYIVKLVEEWVTA